MSNDVGFLHADKHESFLQIHIMILDGDGQAFPEFPNGKIWSTIFYSRNNIF